jgi:serine/threonine protein kinase
MGLSVGEIVLDRYVVEGLVGVGGMGEVYRARHRKLGMPVAVKTITGNASPELIARFAREATLLARVRHPNVVSILDVGQTQNGSECMVMEFLEGEALDARLARRGALPWPEVRAIGLSILKGLDAIHAAGIVHRDLKPGNVLIARGSPEVVKLVDFGIAHASSGQGRKYTRTGAMIGTPAYMPPEQLVGGTVDARSDLYALGLLLFELAVGSLPFGDDSNGALRRLREALPLPVAPDGLPPLPEHGAEALQHALALDPERRPQSARELYALLRGARRAEPVARSEYDDASVHPAREPRHAGTQVGAAARSLVAARLPVSRMSREEQKQLAQLAAPGRAYHMGGGIWFAVLSGPGAEQVKRAAQHLCGTLLQRYGDTCKVVWSPASNDFALTPASLSGAAPLPPDIAHLLQHLL